MARGLDHPDVLVLGEHPSAYLASALLASTAKLAIAQAAVPAAPIPDRLVIVNPTLYALHPMLEPLRRRLTARPIFGVQFLADSPSTRAEFQNRSALALVCSFRELRRAFRQLASDRRVQFLASRQLSVVEVDEYGVTVLLNGRTLRPRALILAEQPDETSAHVLGMEPNWEAGILHRYTYVTLRGLQVRDFGPHPVMPMSLDLCGMLLWGWLLPGPRQAQLAVQQPVDRTITPSPADLLAHWLKVLQDHCVIPADVEFDPAGITSLDLPIAGALAQEGVASRTLLIGPAGGFLSSSAEEIYPACWSAIYACEVLKKALQEEHLQDALQPFRQRWRTTLGEYLRGPQQNLRLLLPLVYRNQIMTRRLAEAILTGAKVAR